jgi:L-rhamnose mutarotase
VTINGETMKRFAQTVMLKDDPEIIRQYENHHANSWPEVVEGTLKCGVRRVYIYRYGCQLFMFMETVDDFDMARDMPKYMSEPRAREWDKLMRSFQRPVVGAPEGSSWVEMKEIYALEAGRT